MCERKTVILTAKRETYSPETTPSPTATRRLCLREAADISIRSSSSVSHRAKLWLTLLASILASLLYSMWTDLVTLIRIARSR